MEQLCDFPMIVRGAGAHGFVRINPAFHEKTGLTCSELAEKPLLDWIDPGDHAAVRALLEGGKEAACRALHRTRDGALVPLHLRVTDDGHGTVVLGCAVALESDLGGGDVDDATVSSSLNTIARIIEDQNPGYRCSILLVADGRFVRGAGPSLPEEYNAAIDGFAIGPTVGSCGTAIYWNVPVIVHDIQADPLWTPFRELAKNAGVAACWSHPFTSRGGRVLGALALYAPEPSAPTTEQLGALRAAARMTGLAVERGRAEEALREKRKRELELEEQLRQAAKMEALGVLAGGVAHDFNNVLTTILANAELALELSPPDGDIADMLRAVVTASQRAGSFCSQMLAYAGRGTLRTARIELRTLLPQLSDLVQAALSKKTSLAYALHDGPVFVDGDENQLLQVIMNLITNAAEALGDEEGRIVVGSELAHYDAATLDQLAAGADLPAGEYVRVTVSDTGCGMDAETMARIFDPFYTTKFTGRGLGLAAVKGIVLKHRGAILIDSKLGVGTTFAVLLPAVESAPGHHVPASEIDVPVGARRRVLIADDEASIRAILSRRLRDSGFDIIEACDGQQALDVFREDVDAIDCVLLDLSMPKLSGEEVHREMRRLREDVPVVVMSGYTEQEILNRFGEANLVGAIQKPFRAAELIAVLREATA